MRMTEGEDYLRNTWEVKIKLTSLGKPIEDQILVQLVLNGLPCNYEGRIHTLSNHDAMPNYSQVTFKLLTKANVMEFCNKQLRDEGALAVNFSKMHERKKKQQSIWREESS